MTRLAAIILICAIAAAAMAQTALGPGKEVRLDAGKTTGEILVYVPSDYNDDCNWPVIFYYHGQGGRLSTQWLQTATGGKGFVIVSLEFVSTTSGNWNPIKYRVYIEQEIKNLAYVRHYLQGQLKIDPKMTVLAGLSRGGWLVANIFLIRPQLAAAAVITCAGYSDWLPENGSSLAGKYVYIGAGETDQNLKPAKKAKIYFENRRADVMFEIYGGLGHEIDPNAPKMKKWFSDLQIKLTQPKPKIRPIRKELSADFNSCKGQSGKGSG